jgi:hypothetical protein
MRIRVAGEIFSNKGFPIKTITTNLLAEYSENFQDVHKVTTEENQCCDKLRYYATQIGKYLTGIRRDTAKLHGVTYGMTTVLMFTVR